MYHLMTDLKEDLRIGGNLQLQRTRNNFLELEIGRWLPAIGKIGRKSLGRRKFDMGCMTMMMVVIMMIMMNKLFLIAKPSFFAFV